MRRLTAYVSGMVQKAGYRARVVDLARLLKLKGTVENLDDGRVKIVAEGDEDKLNWFEEAINKMKLNSQGRILKATWIRDSRS
jgi:acylphosphatase